MIPDKKRYDELNIFLAENNLECKNLDLLNKALTHGSYTHENNISSFENYERLEFLGDAVLKLIASNYLYETFNEAKEGDLTKIRSILVSDNTISKFAEKINLGKYMIFGESEKKSGGEKRKSNLACAFEALLGALFLEKQSIEDISKFLLGFIEEEVKYIKDHELQLNAKSILQEYSQEKYKTLPVYSLIKEAGPAHKKEFEIQVSIENNIISSAIGSSKKEAQQNAAYKALQKLQQQQKGGSDNE